MNIRRLSYPERPTRGQTVILVGNRLLPACREQLRLLEGAGCTAYLVEGAANLQSRWLLNLEEVRLMVSSSATPEMVSSVEERLQSVTPAPTLAGQSR
jgi:4-hydroxy-3-methylbut-2-enyl diphosphate reductase IspH